MNAVWMMMLLLPSPATELKAALADARRLDSTTAVRTRYLTLQGVAELNRDDTKVVLDFWINCLSREAEFAKMRRVTPTILAVSLDDFGIDAATWDKLADEDPYFSQQIKVEVGATFLNWDGGYSQAKAVKAGVATVPATWLPQKDALEVTSLTQSPAPILRADWWLSRTLIQADRKGTGYYDFLAVKDRKDFEKLVALDVKESQRVKREVAGIVARSNVSQLPRQVFRFQSVTGGYWVTRDALDNNRDERNALRNLDGDYKHQAEEIYGVLPNGMYAFFLGDDKGVRQDSAPDKLSSDETAPGRDRRIHVGLSCVRCHVEGLRPVNDWGRKIFTGPLKLSSPDAVKLRRLQHLYLGELQERIDEDSALYAKRLFRLTGQKPDAMAKMVGSAWANYVERDVMPGDAARELGLTEAVYMTRLKAYYGSNQLADPVLASHIAGLPIRIDDWEQLMPLVCPIVLTPSK